MNRHRFPLNVHSEISMASQGVSMRTKKSIIIVILIILSGIITFLFYNLLKETMFGLLSGMIGLTIGIAVSVFIYQFFIVNKDLERFEDSKSNKVFKFFKLAVSTGMSEKDVLGVECVRMQTGPYFISVSFSIGNIDVSSEMVSEEMFDKLFYLLHKQRIKPKIYTVRDEWETSTLHHTYLQRISQIQDQKLRATLSLQDHYLSTEIYSQSSVPIIVVSMLTSKNKLHTLEPIINFLNEWKKTQQPLSSIREVTWLTREQVVAIDCRYLGTKMIDASPLADKTKNVVFEIRRLLKAQASETAFTPYGKQTLELDTQTYYMRESALASPDTKRKRRNR